MAIFSALGSLIGGAQARAGAEEGADGIKEMWNSVKGNFTPWMNAGANAANSLGDMLTPGGTTSELQPWQQMGADRIANTANPFDPNSIGEGFQKSPGYQFMVDESQNAVDASAAAKGNLLSGATVKAGMDRSNGLANQDYWNYVNQQQNGMQLDAEQRNQQFSNVFGFSGQGLQAAGTSGQLAMSGAQTIGDLTARAGQAGGDGISGAFGAIGKFLNPFG